MAALAQRLSYRQAAATLRRPPNHAVPLVCLWPRSSEPPTPPTSRTAWRSTSTTSLAAGRPVSGPGAGRGRRDRRPGAGPGRRDPPAGGRGRPPSGHAGGRADGGPAIGARRSRRLQQAAADLQQAKQAWLSHWEAERGAPGRAPSPRRVIRRELARQPEITLTLVREALELAAGSPDVRLQLNPEDHKRWGRRCGR